MHTTPSSRPTSPKKIVPPSAFTPHVLAMSPATGSPSLQHHGGPVLGSVEVVPIYWGAAWAAAATAPLTAQLDAFFDFVVTSPMMDLLAEYGTAATPITHGRRLTSLRLAASEPAPVGGKVSDAQIQQALQAWITAGTVPAVTANTLYFIFLPPNVTCTMPDGSQSCGAFCGYHEHIGGAIYYAVIPYVNCTGCAFGGNFLDTLTEVSSHELCEAITDPALNAWWNSATGDEIGDICNRQTVRMGGYLVQTEWSNRRGICAAGP